MSHRLAVCVKVAEHACARTKALFPGNLKRQFIDMSGDTPNRFSIHFGDEELCPSVAEKGVLAWGNQFDLLATQLRNRIGNTCGEGIAYINKGSAASLVPHMLDHYIAVCHALAPY